jgi:hypothetical protein|tara:strand:- start:511 stop:804 length:294 start_codon:yes stop_codon:yes gene_type:complete
MPRYRYENNELVQYTAQEEALRDAEETAWTNGAYDRSIKELRTTRNNLLAKTDYLALSDNTMSSELTTYRQALRDATNGLTTVVEVEAYEFPTEVLA